MNVSKEPFTKIPRELLRFARRLPLMISSLRKIYRHGGHATFNLSFRENGQLLDGKRILITGGSAGIGFSIAQKSLQQGAEVLITGRDATRLEAAAMKLRHPLLRSLAWDIAKTKEIEAKTTEASHLLGGQIDILVNNAGIIDGMDFPNVKESTWDRIYSTNSKGVFFLTQEICRSWLENTSGKTRKVINISSQGGFVGASYPYRMTKWDIAGLTQGLGIKLAPHGILVNGIAPGVTATEMQPEVFRQQENAFFPGNPLQRHALPEEIAELAIFLMSDLSNFIVGQTIVCDGGFSLK